MIFLQFLLSISISSLGVIFDHLTTHVFMTDLGAEFEWNKFFKFILNIGGYKAWIIFEGTIILILALLDSFFPSPINIFPLGLTWFIIRGYVASQNYKIIIKYRRIGIENYKLSFKSVNQFYEQLSLTEKIKLKLPTIIGLVISSTIYLIVVYSSIPMGYFISSLSLGLLGIFIIDVVV